jgi:hypothetical protein
MSSNATLYDTDFFAWANEQAALLRAGRLSEADVANIAEEIESMGRGEKRELESRLAVLSLHLLKWRYQPSFRGNSWRLTIEEQRYQVADHPRDNPSPQSVLDESYRRAYRRARLEAAQETGFDPGSFPETCPYAVDEATSPDFWPD